MKRLKKRYPCPTELALAFVGGKWKTVILTRLHFAPLRYAELRRAIPGISEKELSEKLRTLEALGLVERTVGEDAAAYRLTPRGEGLRPVLDGLSRWGSAMAGELDIALDTGPRA